jgi:hypothetical protein
MRARTPIAAASFLDQLAAYRKIVLDGEPIENEKLITRILDDWRDYPDTEEMWQKITATSIANKIEPPPAWFFIDWLLSMRVLVYEPLGTVVLDAPALIAERKTQAKREWKAGNISWATGVRSMAECLDRDLTQTLGRKKTKAPKKRFILLLRNCFIINCGEPLNDIVAKLTGIFFDDDTDPQNVRDALKPTKQDIRRKKRSRMSPKQ